MERAVLTTWKTFEGRFADAIQMILRYRGVEYFCEYMDKERIEESKVDGQWNTYPKLTFEYKGGEESSFYGTNSILRYVGQTYGFYYTPMKWTERQQADSWVEHCNFLLNGLLLNDATINVDIQKLELMNENFLNDQLEKIDTLVTNTDTFLVDEEISIADFKLFSVITLLSSGVIEGYEKESFKKYTSLYTWCEMFANHYESILKTAKENKKEQEDNYPFIIHKGRYYINRRDVTNEIQGMNDVYKQNIEPHLTEEENVVLNS
jgi:hypothetical protein